ncbi:MAG: Gfo/Idh/MocA family oxidoreductase [Ruminococcaceae bacterium]|nr:Gfo/Idh/MocA family oxidoreductase [Oscillospiraceae bacterium]
MGKIKVALAGFGTGGRIFHAPFIDAHPQFELKYVYERSRKTAQEIYPYVKSLSSYEELVDTDSDLVVIALPNDLHYSAVRQALLKGKNVVCDKPFCPDSRSAAELFELAESKGLFLTVYQNRRLDSQVRTAKKLLSEGILGDIYDCTMRFQRFQTARNKKLWKSSDPTTGIIYDLGIHLIDSAYYLFGMPKAVFCDVRTLHPFNTVCDRADISFYYESGLKVTLALSQAACKAEDALVIHGSKASFCKEGEDPQEKRLNEGMSPRDPRLTLEDEDARGRLYYPDKSFSYYPQVSGGYIDFYTSVFEGLEGGEPFVDKRQAVDVLRLLEASIISNSQKRIIEL